MLSRVNNSVCHWAWQHGHAGFHRHGQCWRFWAWPMKHQYGNGITMLTWWRFFYVRETAGAPTERI